MPHIEFETAVRQENPTFKHIAGIDEAGRGALAGPVVAAAAILPLDKPKKLRQFEKVNDSKQLSAKQRDAFFETIMAHAVTVGIGIVAAEVIDEIGIIPATRRAMMTAINQLAPQPHFLLIDGRIKLPALSTPQQSIVRGDSQSLSIAAASIIAKVTRDRLMVDFAEKFPAYSFEKHKGYGTQFHRDMIASVGACSIHRHSFAPIRKDLFD